MLNRFKMRTHLISIFCTLILSLFLVACERGSQSQGSGSPQPVKTASELPALTPEQKARFESSLQQMGAVADYANSSGSRDDGAVDLKINQYPEFEDEISLRMRTAKCQFVINDPLLPGSTNSIQVSRVDRRISVQGVDCPLEMKSTFRVDSQKLGDSSIKIQGADSENLNITSTELSSKLGISGRIFRSEIQGSVLSEKELLSISFAVQASGEVQSLKEGLIQISGESKSQTDIVGQKIVGTHRASWKFVFSDMTVILEAQSARANDGKITEKYLLNSVEIEQAEYEIYLRKSYLDQDERVAIESGSE